MRIIKLSVLLFSVLLLVRPSHSQFKYGDSLFWGIWKTAKGIKPNIQIEIRKLGNVEVTIDGVGMPMGYEFAATSGGKVVIEFRMENDNNESFNLYLLRGEEKGKPILSGFYVYSLSDDEGEIFKKNITPVVLQNQKLYGWDD